MAEIKERALLREARGAVFHVAEESLNDSNRKLARDMLERIDALLAQTERAALSEMGAQRPTNEEQSK